MCYELVGDTQLKDVRRKAIVPTHARLQQAANVLELQRATGSSHRDLSTASERIMLIDFSSGCLLPIEVSAK